MKVHMNHPVKKAWMKKIKNCTN